MNCVGGFLPGKRNIQMSFLSITFYISSNITEQEAVQFLHLTYLQIQYQAGQRREMQYDLSIKRYCSIFKVEIDQKRNVWKQILTDKSISFSMSGDSS